MTDALVYTAEQAANVFAGRSPDDCGCTELSEAGVQSFSFDGNEHWRSADGQLLDMPSVALDRLVLALQEGTIPIDPQAVISAVSYARSLDAALAAQQWDAVSDLTPQFYAATSGIYQNALDAAGTDAFVPVSSAYDALEQSVILADSACETFTSAPVPLEDDDEGIDTVDSADSMDAELPTEDDDLTVPEGGDVVGDPADGGDLDTEPADGQVEIIVIENPSGGEPISGTADGDGPGSFLDAVDQAVDAGDLEGGTAIELPDGTIIDTQGEVQQGAGDGPDLNPDPDEVHDLDDMPDDPGLMPEDVDGLDDEDDEGYAVTVGECNARFLTATDQLLLAAGASLTGVAGGSTENLSAADRLTSIAKFRTEASAARAAGPSSSSQGSALMRVVEAASQLAAESAILPRLGRGTDGTLSSPGSSSVAPQRSVSMASLMTSTTTFCETVATYAAEQLRASSSDASTSTTAMSVASSEAFSVTDATLLSDSLATILSDFERSLGTSNGTRMEFAKHKNWVEQVGGLPSYIRRIAKHLIERGMTPSHAIASAVNTVKRWSRGGQGVKADTVAKALAALAEWEAKKAAAHATSASTTTLAGEVEAQTPTELLVDSIDAVASGVLSVSNDVREAVGLIAPGTRAAEGRFLGSDVEALREVAEAFKASAREHASSLVASAGGVTPTGMQIPVNPPKAWFTDQKLSGVTPITVTTDGHIYGHIATWNACHLESRNLGSTCVRAPRSIDGYAGFHLGYITTAEGEDIPTGRIVAGAPHADPLWNLNSTLVHYSHSGWVGADVRAYEDRFGIAVTGALRPDITPTQLRALKAAPLSGDWREDPRTGRLALVAALGVSTPGFQVPRMQALVASAGTVSSMFAVGMVPPSQIVLSKGTPVQSEQDLAYLKTQLASTSAWAADADKLDEMRRIAMKANVTSFARGRKMLEMKATVDAMRGSR